MLNTWQSTFTHKWRLLDDQKLKPPGYGEGKVGRMFLNNRRTKNVPENEYLIQINMDKDLKICN